MKRYSLILIVVACLLALTANSALAVFPNYKPGLYPTIGDGEVTLPLQKGWWNGNVTWFICTDTNNLRWAQYYNLTLAPKLSSALDNGARTAYIVTNFNNVGPVFETSPISDEPSYSGLWEILFINWNPGTTPRPITNTMPADECNPYGLPGPDEITITNVPCVPEFMDSMDVDDRIVVNYPIVAIGSLASPKGNPRFGGIYRIPQVIALDARSVPPTITLPTWKVYCRDHITQKVTVARVIIPDVEDEGLARLLWANHAPGLELVPFEDTQQFWVINWRQMNNGGCFVVPPAQYPVVEECPSTFFCGLNNRLPVNSKFNNFVTHFSPFSWRNQNFEYSPIGVYTLLNRFFNPEFPGFTDKSLIKTPEFIQRLLDLELLMVEFGDTRINAPQIPLENGCVPVNGDNFN